MYLQFGRFALVGIVGLFVNIATVYLAKPFINLQWAGGLAFLTAATTTWFLNRTFTFRPGGVTKSTPAQIGLQWLKFLTVNGLGGVTYLCTFWTLTIHSATCRSFPLLAILAGAGMGLVFNFSLSRIFVFRAESPVTR
jgi:putative flippase GtrA